MPAPHRPGLRVAAGVTIPESELSWRALDSLMPWDVYGAMSDDELTAVWTYLRAQPPRKFGGR